MDTILIIVCILAGSFAFTTLLYLYFAYTSVPNPEDEVDFINSKGTTIRFSRKPGAEKVA